MADAQNPRRTRVVPPLQLQLVHKEDLRDSQVIRECIELDPGQTRELWVENDRHELAVDVPLARRNRNVLFHGEDLLLERGIVAESRDTERARRDAVERTTKVARVRVEPVCVHRSTRTPTQLAGQKSTREGGAR